MTKYTPENFLSINGRIRRRTYLIRGTILSIPIVILNYLFSYYENFAIVLIIIIIALTILLVIQFIKRLHDINMSGLYWLLCLIPIVNLIFGLYVVFKEGTAGSNQYGSDPKKTIIEMENAKPKNDSYKTSYQDKKLINKKPETISIENLPEKVLSPPTIYQKQKNDTNENEDISNVYSDENINLEYLDVLNKKREVLKIAKEDKVLTEEEYKNKLSKLMEDENEFKLKIENKKTLKRKLESLNKLLEEELILEDEYKKKKELFIGSSKNELKPNLSKTDLQIPKSSGVNSKYKIIQNKETKLWGYIDSDGGCIDQKFDKAYHFNEGLAAVIHHGKRGYINLNGDFIIDPIYDEDGTYFKDGIATVSLNGEEMKIDKVGKIIK